ncbi:hypothetical protein [uncultured Holdemanella sp.]|uniref:hypothetical protein n=1 Tax=uncultured Holdemanella sp. TaxID=1763549 RepID=UPI0025EEC61D|nr:hypothetical protein [uncultured Holdemanella sp.]
MEKLTLEELKVLESLRKSLRELHKKDLEEVIDFSEELRKMKYSKSKDYNREWEGKK